MAHVCVSLVVLFVNCNSMGLMFCAFASCASSQGSVILGLSTATTLNLLPSANAA